MKRFRSAAAGAAAIVALAGIVLTTGRFAAGEACFRRHIFREPGGGESVYRVFVPPGSPPPHGWPAILYLHGAGSAGDDGLAPTKNGLGAIIRAHPGNFPFVVVFPQSPEDTWAETWADARRALAILDAATAAYAIDRDRVSLTGISIGGEGVWDLGQAHPERWAAIVPVCGYGNPDWGKRLARMPCWCFHGERDTVIPVDESRRLVRAIEAAGGQPRYTEYPDAGHDAWSRAYATGELYEWLLKQRRGGNPY